MYRSKVGNSGVNCHTSTILAEPFKINYLMGWFCMRIIRTIFQSGCYLLILLVRAWHSRLNWQFEKKYIRRFASYGRSCRLHRFALNVLSTYLTTWKSLHKLTPSIPKRRCMIQFRFKNPSLPNLFTSLFHSLILSQQEKRIQTYTYNVVIIEALSIDTDPRIPSPSQKRWG